jgi:hypothetical protein
MIRCQRLHLAARCRQRGYTLEEVRACIVSEDGDQITIDETHDAYPREPKPLATSGPGAELKKLLKRIGIVSKPNCSCNAHARRMDEMGCDWCAANVPTITEWMRGEAAKRKLPFIATLAGLMVRRAIHNARKEASNNATKENAEGEAV